MSDIHALSGAFAVDALDDLERARFEQHLAVCPECRAEVASFRETAALIAETEAQTPPESLRAGVLAGISQMRPLPPETAHRTAPSRRRLPRLLATAAAVVVLAGALAWHPWSTGSRSGTDVVAQVLHSSDAVRTTERLPGGQGRLILVRSASLDRAVMLARNVPPPQQGTTYQLWLQRPDGHVVSAGLMPDVTRPTLLSGDPDTATAAAVSVEPSRGSPQPTTKPIALFSFSSGTRGNDGA